MPCPRCRAQLTVTAADAGRQIACGSCGQPIVLPAMPMAAPPMGMPPPMMYPPPPNSGSGFGAVGIVVVVLLVLCAGGGAAAWFFVAAPATQKVREAAANSQAANNAKQLMIGLHSFEQAHRSFPLQATLDPSGQPLLSWRVQILPYLERRDLYDRFHHNEPWDSPHNRSLIHEMPPVFASPNVPLPPGRTCWQAVIGPRSVIVGKSQAVPGVPQAGVGLQQIVDGTSNTIAIVEVNPDRAVVWTQPDDFDFNPAMPTSGLGEMRHGAFIAGFCDGSVRTIQMPVDAANLRDAFDREDGRPVMLP